MIPRAWLAGGLAAMLAASHSWTGWHFYNRGFDRANAKHEEAIRRLEVQLRDANDTIREGEERRLDLERERNVLIWELNNQGDQDVGAGRMSVPRGSVLRIDPIGR